MERITPLMPRAREDELVVEELPDETLVYDLERHKAHCLNPTAAFVWRHCDGQTSVSELARLLEDELGTPANEEVVWLALDRLERVHLLQEQGQHRTETPRYSRRQVVKRLGQIAVPMVVSIVAPRAAHAATCISELDCLARLPPCGGQPICFAIDCCLQAKDGISCEDDDC